MMEESYVPDEKILERYAKVLVNFALNDGKGIDKGEVVFLEVPECAKSLLIHLQKAVLSAGGNYITNFIPDGLSRHFYEMANDEQLEFFPEKYLKGKAEELKHRIVIIADTDKHELEGINPEKIMTRQKSFKKYRDWLEEKEKKGEYYWTLAMYGTEAMAKEAEISLREYWEQIIRACYLDRENPVEELRKAFKEIKRVKEKLNSLKIEKLRVKGEGTDLVIGIGEGRKWLGGTGHNIPSFEVYISPDCRMTEGTIKFDMPLYRYGSLIEEVELTFKKGRVVEMKARRGEDVLKSMISVEGADMVGEYSLTDKRLSRINKFMAETLYDENFGGEYGNTHLALGNAYKDSYTGDAEKLSKKEWKEKGFNESVVHTDIVMTKNREVTAYFADGTSKIIYKDGVFTL